MLTDMAPGQEHTGSARVHVHAPYNGAGLITVEQSKTNPDLGQDAVDSLFD